MKNLFILASHGDLAKGMKSTIGMLYGNQENILAYGLHDGENVRDLYDKVEEQVMKTDAGNIIAVTDLPGGSVNNNLLELVGKKDNFYLISGMNVGVILNLVLNEDISEDLIQGCIEEGKNTMQLFTADSLKADEDEGGDFFD